MVGRDPKNLAVCPLGMPGAYMSSVDRYSLLFSFILGVESLGYAMVLPLVPFMAQRYGAARF